MSSIRRKSVVGPYGAGGNPDAPRYVCWTRMQAEAGQLLDAIVVRKERERLAGDGLFLWGVGNAPSTAIKSLARLEVPIPVVFSGMKTKPKAVDVAPKRTVLWRRFIDECGVERVLPDSALVTSRGDSASGVKSRHYALMCHSDDPLQITRGVTFDPAAFRNVSGAGAPVGASQVTALLQQVAKPSAVSDYEANIVAWLTGGYWVRLTDPLELGSDAIRQINEFDGDADQWLKFAKCIRGESALRFRGATQAGALL